MPLVRSYLDLEGLVLEGCQDPTCDQSHPQDTLLLKSRCHSHAGIQVSDAAGSRKLRMRCNVCEAYICDVVVALESHGQ